MMVIQLPKYVTHIIGEPKFKYGKQEQVKVRNYNRSTAFELSVLKYWGLNNLKRDPLETQHPKFEESRHGFIESVHKS